MERSLTQQLGEEVGTFSSYQSDLLPGLFIEGFESGPGATSQDGPHLGYAVFETYDNGGFKLLRWYRGENAAITNAGIHFCTEPLVVNGREYQVVLVDNDNLARVTWISPAGEPQSMETHIGHYMDIFDPGCTEIRFWDETGAEIVAD